jgi:hypothetical protein
MNKMSANLGVLVFKFLKRLESIDGCPDYWTNCQRAPRLLDQVRAGACLHYSRRTGDSYASWIKRFISLYGKQP